MIKKHGRAKLTKTLAEQIAADSKRARDIAHKLPPGSEREALLRIADQNDAATAMNAWQSAWHLMTTPVQTEM